MAVAIVEVGPFENGEACENLQEKLVWKFEYWGMKIDSQSQNLGIEI